MEHNRIVLLDELRGLAVIGMVVYHFIYTLSVIFEITIGSTVENAMRFSQPILAGLFILIAGFTCRFSKSNYKRGLQILLFGLGISLFTYIVIPEQIILFGILHFLGTSILLFEISNNLTNRMNRVSVLSVSMVMFIITYNLHRGFIYIPFLGKAIVPVLAYPWLSLLGLPTSDFYSADYFPMFPWYALFIIGTVLGAFAGEIKLHDFCYRTHSKVLYWIGRKSLVIYLVHQPLIYIILRSIISV